MPQLKATEPTGWNRSLVHVLQRRAEAHPERIAYTFLDERGDAATLTYAHLEERSARLATRVAAIGAPGDRIILVLQPGLDYIVAFFACLHVGRIAVPVAAPHPGRPDRGLARLEAICKDCQPVAAIVESSFVELQSVLAAEAPVLGALPWLVTACGEEARAAPSPADIAVLQYTSGSTADPKGVILGHDNIIFNLSLIERHFRQTPETCGVFWLPPYHDMGLVGGILEPLYAGYHSVLMAPTSFITQPMRWLKAIERYGGTTSGGPNFAFDLCVDQIDPQERQGLDLRSWSLAFNGAEPIRATTIERFANAFAPSGFRRTSFLACYGLAEATLLVACGDVGDGINIRSADRDALSQNVWRQGDLPLASCGRAADSLDIRIVDPGSGEPARADTVGEIWIAGPSVARGYWNRPAHDDFDRILGDRDGYLRSGDLGSIVDGELLVTGRRKDLIIVRGQNHYPQDLEAAALAAHPDLRGGTAAALACDETDDALMVVVELRRAADCDVDLLARAVRRNVVKHCGLALAAVVFVKRGAIPKTTSGKVRRQACRDALSTSRLDILAESRADPRDLEGPTKDAIVAARGAHRLSLLQELIFAALARAGVPDAALPDRLIDLVGDSFGLIELAGNITQIIGIDVDLEDTLGDTRICDLADRIAARMETDAPRPEAPSHTCGLTDDFRLTLAQSALWFEQQRHPDSTTNNVTVAFRVWANIGPERLQAAVSRVAERHALLRVSIEAHDGVPRFRPGPSAHLEIVDGPSARDAETATEIAARPFDLEHGPLWRVSLILGRPNVLVLCAHHIVADYASLQIILRDLESALRGVALLPPAHEHIGLLARELSLMSPPRMAASAAYWRKTLADAPLLDIPLLRSSATKGHAVAVQHVFSIPQSLLRSLRALARREHTTLHAVLRSALHVLLYRLSGQDDTTIGTPVTSRRRAWMRNLVDYCVNPLPVRVRTEATDTFAGILCKVRDATAAAISHELPLPSLIERAGIRHEGSRNPMFRVLFALEQSSESIPPLAAPVRSQRFAFAGVDLEPIRVEPVQIDFDLRVIVEDTPYGSSAAFTTAADAPQPDCASWIATRWQRMLQLVAANPDEKIATLMLLEDDEREALAEAWRRGRAVFVDRCLHLQMEDQARRTPNTNAVIDIDGCVSYETLAVRAATIATALRRRGFGVGTRIGLHLGRRTDTIAAILGVLGCGAAYVYLDPRYPTERLGFMIGDADLAAVIYDDRIVEVPTKVFRLRIDDLLREPSARSFPATDVRSDDLAYVIYTSGSTGRPKGVAIEHRSAAALLTWAHDTYGASQLAGTLAATAFSFDLSIFELFAPLTCGGCVILADSVLDLPDHPARDRVTLVNTVPSAMSELVAGGRVPPSVRTVNLAGEPLSTALVASVYELGHVDHVFNLYGPTEDTTYSTFERVENGAKPTIGTSVAYKAAYILDDGQRPVPHGVVGEIVLGGAGVARGYLNRPELTAERFVESPIPEAPGRLYRTGDLGRRLPDGRIEYLGRRDRQVKLRGYRIELEEITAVLLAHDTVSDAAVTTDDLARITAFIVPRSQTETSVVRRDIASLLPSFMVPHRIVAIDAIPLTANGKIDYSALGRLAISERSDAQRPKTPIEVTLAAIWHEVLGIDPSVEDDFFRLGGHSLLAARLQARVRDRLGVEIPLTGIFDRPRLRDMAEMVATSHDRIAPPAIVPIPRGCRDAGPILDPRG